MLLRRLAVQEPARLPAKRRQACVTETTYFCSSVKRQ